MRTTIQIPIDSVLRNEAEKAAQAAGFSSIQEVVRVFLKKFSQQAIEVNFSEPDVKLSKQAEKRYSSMVNDAKVGKNVVKVHSHDELIGLLD